jgi:hypothetical protein
MRPASSFVLLFGALALVAPSPAGTIHPGDLIVHEWGTFTSVAGEDGRAVEWVPQARGSDLPSFVDRIRVGAKHFLPVTVRMETPVIYFYASRETIVDVSVRFRNGIITEWFPRAVVTPAGIPDSSLLRRSNFQGTIAWSDVTVSPRGWSDFPAENNPSHYYAARETDASPLETGSQREKFLFYRGVACFEPPITATATADGTITVNNPHHEPLGDIILFENLAGRMAYEVRHGAGEEAIFAPGLPDGDSERLFDELASILVANGLYPREAKAMIATWRDSWFGEGTRLFYVVSRRTIDAILPLDIRPRPSEVARVFVGRVELDAAAALQVTQGAPVSSN